MTHTHDVEQALKELQEDLPRLPELLTTGSTKAAPRRPQPSSRPPLRLDVLQLLDTRNRHDWLDGMQWCDPEGVGVLPYLWGWCRDLASTLLDENPRKVEELPEHPTLATVTTWLTDHLDHIATLPQWPDFAAGVLWVSNAVARTLNPPQPGTSAIPCPTPGCSGMLARDQAIPNAWHCLLGCDPGQTTVTAVTLPEAAKRTGIPLRTLQHWAQRRRITAINHAEKDVIERIQLTRKTGNWETETLKIDTVTTTRMFDLDQIKRLARTSNTR